MIALIIILAIISIGFMIADCYIGMSWKIQPTCKKGIHSLFRGCSIISGSALFGLLFQLKKIYIVCIPIYAVGITIGIILCVRAYLIYRTYLTGIIDPDMMFLLSVTTAIQKYLKKGSEQAELEYINRKNIENIEPLYDYMFKLKDLSLALMKSVTREPQNFKECKKKVSKEKKWLNKIGIAMDKTGAIQNIEKLEAILNKSEM